MDKITITTQFVENAAMILTQMCQNLFGELMRKGSLELTVSLALSEEMDRAVIEGVLPQYHVLPESTQKVSVELHAENLPKRVVPDILKPIIFDIYLTRCKRIAVMDCISNHSGSGCDPRTFWTPRMESLANDCFYYMFLTTKKAKPHAYTPLTIGIGAKLINTTVQLSAGEKHVISQFKYQILLGVSCSE